jgi:hypothetical protein
MCHSFHNAVPVNLDRVLTDSKLGSSLLVELARDDVRHDLALSHRELLNSATYFTQLGLSGSEGSITIERFADGVQQILVTKGFRKEIDRPRFHRLHGHRDVAVGRDVDNRDRALHAIQLTL